MTAGETNPINWPRVRWFHYILLGILLTIGGIFRWHQIDKQSLWIDEYWALYLATGRGDQLFEIPREIILSVPPQVGFEGAPHWWHILSGLGNATHPPAYFLMLRGWVDCFGDSDRAIRSMSAVFSLAGVVVLFSLVRRLRGPSTGLIAAGMMSLAPMQIDYSQTTRPYTMLVFFSLLFCHALVSITIRSCTRRRLLLLGASAMAMALTHYFSVGAISGGIVYAAMRFAGKKRASVLISVFAGLVLAGLIWGPFFWGIRGSFDAFPNFAPAPVDRAAALGRAIVTTPAQILLEPGGPWTWRQSLPLALLVYAAPLLLARKYPEMLLWWLWIAGSVGVVVAIDFLRGTSLTGVIRYFFILSPAIFIVLATILPGTWAGRFVSYGTLACVAIYGFDRFQVGPAPTQDWKTLTRLTNQLAGPGDTIGLIGTYDFEPGFDYFVMSHYMGSWRRPVIFLTEFPREGVMRELALRERVWVIGNNPNTETRRIFPSWRIGDEHGAGIGNLVWAVLPPESAKRE